MVSTVVDRRLYPIVQMEGGKFAYIHALQHYDQGPSLVPGEINTQSVVDDVNTLMTIRVSRLRRNNISENIFLIKHIVIF